MAHDGRQDAIDGKSDRLATLEVPVNEQSMSSHCIEPCLHRVRRETNSSVHRRVTPESVALTTHDAEHAIHLDSSAYQKKRYRILSFCNTTVLTPSASARELL